MPTEEDLPEFHAAMAGSNHRDNDSVTGNSLQHDLDFDSSDEMEAKGLCEMLCSRTLHLPDLGTIFGLIPNMQINTVADSRGGEGGARPPPAVPVKKKNLLSLWE